MTAKEMFESIGWKQTHNEKDLVRYSYYHYNDGWYDIEFDRNNFSYGILHKGKMVSMSLQPVTFHKAVYKQMKELNWI